MRVTSLDELKQPLLAGVSEMKAQPLRLQCKNLYFQMIRTQAL